MDTNPNEEPIPDKWSGKRVEERFAYIMAAVESASDAIGMSDAQGHHVYQNKALSDLFEYSTAEELEAAGGGPAVVRDPMVAREMFDRIMHGKSWAGELEMVTRSGRVFPAFERADAILDSAGAVIGLIGVITDITERRKTEEALRESQARYQRITEGLTDYQYTVRVANGRPVETTHGPACATVTGYTAEEFQADPYLWLRMVVPEDSERVTEWVHLVLSGQEAPPIEHRILCKGGAVRWVSDLAILHKDASGNLLSYDGVVKDVTERKQAEEALRESEERFRKVFEDGPLGMAVLTVSEGRFVEVNAAFCQMLGYAREELKRLVFADVTHPDDRARDVEAVRRLWAGQIPCYKVEKRYLAKDGRTVWGALAASLVFDTRGKPLYSLAMVQDITERKRAHEELLASQQLVQGIINTIPVRVFWKDRNLVYLGCNAVFAHDAGFADAKDIIGKDDFQMGWRDQAELYRADDRQVIESGRPKLLIEEPQTTPDGNTITLLTSKTPLRSSEGEITGVLGTYFDITERKRAEEERATLEAQLRQAQKLESVGRLAGGVAHDFNNMLAVILGHTELALDEVEASHPLHAALREIEKAARHSASLTNQLLAFARRQTVVPKVLNLNDVVEPMLKMLRRLVGEDITVAWHAGAQLWPVKIDPVQVDQILANLCVNARDAIAEVGRLTIETHNATLDAAACRSHPGAAPGDYVVLAVSDTGCGMSAEVLDRIFEPFFTTKQPGQGTGLGLATVYGIVRQNDGFATVSSEPGVGTTFRIHLRRHAGETAKAMSSAAVEMPRGRGETVLLVEDEPAILALMTTMLDRQGYTVLAAGTSEEAIRLAKEHAGEIHLIMTDVVMPEMNGRDLMARIVEYRPAVKRLFMSGYTADIIAQRGIMEADVHFLQKPFALRDLATKVREALDTEQN